MRRQRHRAVLLSLGLAACGKDDAPPAADGASPAVPSPVAEASPPHAPEDLPTPGVKEDGSIVSAVPWFEGSLEQALEQASKKNKLVFVHVGAYWCPPCHRLDEEVFTQPSVGRVLGERTIALHVDAEKGEGPEIAERYHVQAYPTLLVLEPTGVEKGRVVDFLPAEDLVAALDRIAAGKNVLEHLVAEVELAPDDLSKRYALGNAYALSARRELAEEQYEIVMLGDPHDELGLASSVLYDRALFFRYKLDGDAHGAIAAFQELQTRYPESKAASRAYRQIGRILHQLGRSDEAIRSLERMLAEDPDDPSLASSFGWFSFREKCNPARGLEVVTVAIHKNPEEAELHYLSAELSHLLGDDAAALRSMRRASDLEPRSAYYQRQVRRFEEANGA